MGTKNVERRSKELVSIGLMQNGQTISAKQVGEERTRSRTMFNGTGQVSLSTETRCNNSLENTRTCTAGPMQVSEVAPGEEVSMMDGSLVLALVSTGAAVLNGIGILMTRLKYRSLFPVITIFLRIHLIYENRHVLHKIGIYVKMYTKPPVQLI